MKTVAKMFIAVAAMGITTAFAQEPLDGAYQKVLNKEREIIPYDYIREADVFWSKRIWRTIDTREKMNLPFRYPQMPLIDIIHTAAKNGEITVYDPAVDNADQFKLVMPVGDVSKIGASTDTSMVVDPITLEEKQVVSTTEFNPMHVVKFRLKEDWVFDEETSTMMVRIIGICPVSEKIDQNTQTVLGDQPMYWVYYPDLRPVLAKYEVFNPKNDAVTLSWEDLFEARKFASYISKESNVYDRTIAEYAAGIDGLLESDKIKNDIFVFEHDLWNY
ncbi:MAG: gliding motility protein GldN [Chitinophagales bacterium]|nr:gliding motility protein GldN [Chitinophagales bacterium]